MRKTLSLTLVTPIGKFGQDFNNVTEAEISHLIEKWTKAINGHTPLFSISYPDGETILPKSVLSQSVLKTVIK